MRSIVVPVNFTPNSANAACYAAELALAIGARIHLVYVLQLPVTTAEMPVPECLFEQMRNNGFGFLKELSEDLVRRTGGRIDITAELEIGGVDAKIRDFCDRKKPFLVIMGASGHSLSNTWEGSHTARTLLHLSYPLLVIPGNARFHPVHHVILACDRADIDSGIPSTHPFIKELGELFDVRLEVMHVITEDEDSASEAIVDYNEWKGDSKAFGPELCIVRTKEVKKGIDRYMNGHKGDWLMVFPKKHSLLEFHKSKAKQVALNCALPVISLPV